MQDRRVDVLYILGAGRSGSTVLEQVISGMPDYTCVGETCYMDRRGRQFDELCSCGLPFSGCPFWKAVIGEVFNSDEDFAAYYAEQAYLARIRHIPWLRVPRLRSKKFRERLSCFHRMQASLFTAIRKESGREVVVDSSKFATFGYVLAANPALDVRAIHLVRDARGVVFSWQRTKRRPEATVRNTFMPTLSAPAATRNWILDNFLATGMRHWLRRAELLRYEDYCLDPSLIDDALTRLWLPIGGEPTDAGADDGGESPGAAHHSVSGNPARLKRGPVTLLTDNEWRTRLDRRDRIIVTGLASMSLMRYGYLPRRRCVAR